MRPARPSASRFTIWMALRRIKSMPARRPPNSAGTWLGPPCRWLLRVSRFEQWTHSHSRVGAQRPGDPDVARFFKGCEGGRRKRAENDVRFPGRVTAPLTISRPGASANTPQPMDLAHSSSGPGNSVFTSALPSINWRLVTFARMTRDGWRSKVVAAAKVIFAGAPTSELVRSVTS